MLCIHLLWQWRENNTHTHTLTNMLEENTHYIQTSLVKLFAWLRIVVSIFHLHFLIPPSRLLPARSISVPALTLCTMLYRSFANKPFYAIILRQNPSNITLVRMNLHLMYIVFSWVSYIRYVTDWRCLNYPLTPSLTYCLLCPLSAFSSFYQQWGSWQEKKKFTFPLEHDSIGR